MKTFISSAILLCAIALPARAELTNADLDKIRLIIKEEIKAELKPIKTEIDTLKTDVNTLKTDVAWMRGKLEGIDKQFASIDKQVTHATNVTYGLIALIVVAVGIPQIIITWGNTRNRHQERINQELRQEIEALKQQRIIITDAGADVSTDTSPVSSE